MTQHFARSIVAASDLSEGSDPVLRAAGALAALTDAELHVVHALELPVLPYAHPEVDPSLIGGGEDAANEMLREQLGRALPAHAEAVSAEVVIGAVHQAVLERAAAVGAELLVVGPHRLRPFADRFLGSTADRLIRTATVPCLLVRGRLNLPLRRVMVPTDLSEHSHAALDVALQWVRLLGAAQSGDQQPTQLQVVHIVPRAYEMPDFAFDEEVIAPELERVVQQALERAGADVRPPIREIVTWGDLPADEIIAVAQKQRADLLVIGTHGHGALRRVLLGSVASSIARAAPCPVLLVPPAADVEA